MAGINDLIAQPNAQIFRRLQMRRRLASGEYEASWQTIDASKIRNWGRISWQTDSNIVGSFQQSGVEIDVYNGDSYFNDENDPDSFWYGYYTRARTLVRIQAGYLDTAGAELPATPTIFSGLLQTDFSTDDTNRMRLQADTLDGVFRNIPASSVVFPNITATAQAADQLLTDIRNYTDGSNNLVFQKFIPTAGWTITTSTITYPGLNTTTVLRNLSCWDMIKKLAEAENYVAYIDRTGNFVFTPRPTTTAAVTYGLRGIGSLDRTYGHNIIHVGSRSEMVSKVLNRIRVKYAEPDTETSFYTRTAAWTWGDGSVADRYGLQSHEIDNEWIGTSTVATTIGDAIYNQFSVVRYELEILAKFIPQIGLGDIVDLTYAQTPSAVIGPQWGVATWGAFLWARNYPAGSVVYNGVRFQVIGASHDLNKFTTSLTLRQEAG